MQNDSEKPYFGGRTSKSIIFFEIYAKFRHIVIYVTSFRDIFGFWSERCGIPCGTAAEAAIPVRYSDSDYRNEISAKNRPIYVLLMYR